MIYVNNEKERSMAKMIISGKHKRSYSYNRDYGYQNIKGSVLSAMEPYFYLLPSLLVFGLFMYYPFFKTIYISLGLTDSHGTMIKFVGLKNYFETIASSDFINSLIVTIKYVIITVIPSITIGLVLALLANKKIKGSGIYKVMFSLPMSVSSSAAAIIWMIIFHPTIGVLNVILKTSIGWLIDPKYALVSVAAVTVWMNLGVNFIFILSGLKNVPEELVESASIDGAGYFKKLFRILLPIISPTLFFVIFINIMNAFQAFGQVNIMTGGGPGNATNVLVFSIYREAFFNGRFDSACVQSILLFIMMLGITLLQFRFEKKGVHYS